MLGALTGAWAGGATARPADALPPRHVSQTVNLTFPIDYYTQQCGVTAWSTLTGQLDATLFTDQSGTVVREVDTQPGTTETFSSSAGRSFSFPVAATLVTSYPDGSGIGSPAVVSGDGLSGKIPGVPADAGRITIQATVVELTDQGVPITAFGPVTSMNGHANDPAVADAAICTALRG